MLQTVGSHPFRSLPPGRRAPRPVGRVRFVMTGSCHAIIRGSSVPAKREDRNATTQPEDIALATSPCGCLMVMLGGAGARERPLLALSGHEPLLWARRGQLCSWEGSPLRSAKNARYRTSPLGRNGSLQ